MSKIYLDENGELVKEGAIIKNPYLASTLELMTQTENIFYNGGEIGAEMVQELTVKVIN
jgi:gamma-glutamyltranspeptidase